MKTKIIIVALLLFSSICKSQINLEHSYPKSSNIGSLSVINLSNSGYKYCFEDNVTKTVKLYNLNHTLWKTITLNVPTGYNLSGVFYISETLFNSDALTEFCYSYAQYISTPPAHMNWETTISNESGTVLLTI